MGKLTGKVALVTGASAGIGRAAALALACEGTDLVVTARRSERLEALAADAAKFGVKTVCVAGDLRQEATAKAVVDAAMQAFGRIDILIANAGVGNYKNLVDSTLAEYDDMMDGNMKTSWLITRHTVPVMMNQKDGLILLVSSIAGLYGYAGEATYCATKFAQVGFAQGLDKELRPHGIKVGTINPGGVKTEFALGRGRTEESVEASAMMRAEDVAAAIVFAATQPKLTRILQIQMRPMEEG